MLDRSSATVKLFDALIVFEVSASLKCCDIVGFWYHTWGIVGDGR